MQTFPLSWELAGRAFRAVPDWGRKIIKAWLVWFWSLSTVTKTVVTGVEIVCLWFALPHVPLIAGWRTAILEFGSVGLVFLLIAGIVFSHPGRG